VLSNQKKVRHQNQGSETTCGKRLCDFKQQLLLNFVCQYYNCDQFQTNVITHFFSLSWYINLKQLAPKFRTRIPSSKFRICFLLDSNCIVMQLVRYANWIISPFLQRFRHTYCILVSISAKLANIISFFTSVIG